MATSQKITTAICLQEDQQPHALELSTSWQIMRELNLKNCHRKGLMEDELCGCGVKLNDLQNR
jgi:hypothetical protein